MSLHMTKGSSYEDRDGQVKNFTEIDWSPKTKVSIAISKEELDEAKTLLKKDTEGRISAILSLPAVYAPSMYDCLKNRSAEKGITWNEAAVRDSCKIDLDYARDLFNLTWKNTVKPEFWFEDISYEDISKGEWKKYSK